MMVAVVLAVATAGAGTALAGANATTLQGYIVTNPVPGWRSAPQDVQSGESSQISISLSAKTKRLIAIAAAALAGPNPHSESLSITLTRFPGSSVPSSASIPTVANEVCTIDGERPGTISAIPGIPDSSEESCGGSRPPITAAGWAQGNIVAFVVSQGLSMSTVGSIAKTQSAKLPATRSGGSGSNAGLYAGIGVAVLAVAGALWYWRRRSRTRARVPAAAGDFSATYAAEPSRGAGTEPSRTGFRLVATGLRLHLGERQLLDGIDLEVAPGETVAVSGPSGAGKTSLLMILAGVLRPDAGSVHYVPTAPSAEKPLVGFVPQTLALSSTSTAAENVALTLQVEGLEADEMRERALGALAAVGLAGQADRVVTELSGGQRQRVAVARAIALRPHLLIADEATAELDVENQRIVMDLFIQQADAEVAVVVATHDPLVTERCSRTFLLEDGLLREAVEAAGS
jgi:putative ABC transport system ATP-binding protein